MKNKGFALVTVLVLSTLLLIMGMGAMYMTEMGFRSLSAEQRWHRLEKAANAGINEVAKRIARGEECDINDPNLNFNGAAVEVQTVRAGNACFIWSRATLGNSRVVKTAVLTIRPPTDALGAANFVYLRDFRIRGSGFIASCDQNCPTPALVIGNELRKPPKKNLVSSCPNNPKGLVALVDPYVPNAFGQNENLTSRVFNASNREELLSRLTNRFGVNFSNDGTPYINVSSNCEFRDYKSCSTPQPNRIICSSPGKQIIITWSNGVYNITDGNNKPITQCQNVKLPDADIKFNNPFTGGGIIQAKTIDLRSNISNVTFVAERVKIDIHRDTITNVNVFAKDIELKAENGILNGGILYTGGSGRFKIDKKTKATIGTQDNPVLLISDNKIDKLTAGDVQLNGLVYLTKNARKFTWAKRTGNFKLNGMIVSDIPCDIRSDIRRGKKQKCAKVSMNIRTSKGKSVEIRFDRNVLNKLADRYDFVKRPVCEKVSITKKVSITIPFIQTKTTTY